MGRRKMFIKFSQEKPEKKYHLGVLGEHGRMLLN
jgi:hypothetical protein